MRVQTKREIRFSDAVFDKGSVATLAADMSPEEREWFRDSFHRDGAYAKKDRFYNKKPMRTAKESYSAG